ncbi:MAG: DMT family transporter [Bdellovibrionales bacterium]
MQKRTLALFELLVATAVWGMGFVATIWALKIWSAAEVTVLRFFFATLPAAFYFLFSKSTLLDIKLESRLSFWPGLYLALTMVLQTIGLNFTTPAKSAFITTTYVVIVPLLLHFLKDKVSLRHWIWVFVALLGTYFVSGAFEAVGFKLGDIPTILCAFGAALHILSLDKVAQKSKNSIIFGITQSFWALIFCLVFLAIESLIDPGINLKIFHFEFIKIFDFKNYLNTVTNFDHTTFLAWAGILSLAFGSTVIGFTLQVRAQKDISASLASVLFLLEAPMAFLFSYLFLHEMMSGLQWVGAILILASCIGSITFSQKLLAKNKVS